MMAQWNRSLLWLGALMTSWIGAGLDLLYPQSSASLIYPVEHEWRYQDRYQDFPQEWSQTSVIGQLKRSKVLVSSDFSRGSLGFSEDFSSLYAQDVIPEQNEAPAEPEEFDATIEDPELGVLRLIEVPTESFEILDPELGVLRLQELPVADEESDPSVYLRAYSNFFWTSNVLSVVDEPIQDGILQVGLSLSAYPALGSRTYLLSSISGNLVRYTDETNLDYNDIDLSLGVYHAFTRRAYLELGWRNDQFFDRSSGDRFLNDHSFYASVGRRDRFSSRLRLDTEYELEYNLADPISRNRVVNQFRTTLRYQITPELETDLSYRLNLIDFTKQDRNDYYHQLILGVSYDLSSESQISFFGGGRLGDSSESFLDFDSALIGVNISVNLPLF